MGMDMGTPVLMGSIVDQPHFTCVIRHTFRGRVRVGALLITTP
jgi:hypothetical protein